VNFFIKIQRQKEEWGIAIEGAFQAVKHDFSYISMDCTPKLNQVVYSDSAISKKVTFGRTKTEAIVNKTIAPHLVAMEIQDLNEISSLGVSIDGINHGSLKLFPVVVQYFHKVDGIRSQLIDLNSKPNEKPETIVNSVMETLKDYDLLTKCVAFSGNNTNANFGGINCSGNKNVHHALKLELKKKLDHLGCPVHILHSCIQHRADALSMNIECIIMKIYNYFSIYIVRTENLKSYCKFVDINYRQLLLSHSRTRWLSTANVSCHEIIFSLPI
jgi:hypothetical protein